MPLIDTVKLRNDQKKLKEEMRTLCNNALARDDKRMTEQEGAQYHKLDNDVRALESQIELAEKSNCLQMDAEPQPAPEESRNAKDGLSFGDFLQLVARSSNGHIDPRLEKRAPTGLNTLSPEDGGFLVGTDISMEIMRKAMQISNLTSLCENVNISASSNSTSWFELDETSRVAGSRHGGVRGYWTAEGETVTASKPKMIKRKMDLAKLMAFVYATEEQLQDGPAMASLASQLVADEFAWMMDDAIINGAGGALPLGVLNSNALVTIAKETNQTAATVVYENILKMWSRLWAPSRSRAEWYINQDVEPQLSTMAFVVGTSGIPVYLPAGGLSTSPYATLFGRPVRPIEQCKTAGTVGDILLADFSQYKIINKGNVRSESSMHVRFLYDEQVFRFVRRMNGAPKWASALTPANGTNTLSPFVALATRA